MSKYANPVSENEYRKITDDLSLFPVSFRINGKQYKGFPSLEFIITDRIFDVTGNKTVKIMVMEYDNDLKITLDTAFYPDYGVYEWTIWFENAGEENTGIISDVCAADMIFEGKDAYLKGILGDHDNQYRPYCHDLSEKAVGFRSDSGRPTHVDFPYFNLEHGNGGTMLAIGWAGTWKADFEYANGSTKFVAGSTNGLCTYLKPGEKIRTALIVIAPYTVRDEDYATNFWRSWFIHCSMPKADASGADIRPFSTVNIAYDTGIPNSDGSISERYYTWRPSLEKMLEEKVKIDFRWFDAGWYSDPEGNTVETDWWETVGSWELDKVKWPDKTFLESTEFAREHGMKTLMWFEPERVTNPEALARNYGYDVNWAIRRENIKAITNNIGDPKCLKWTTDRIIKVMNENGVDMYREDNNSNPAPLWQMLDLKEGADRAGITEIKVVMGHYRMWDDIILNCAKNGRCTFVDSCASGGGRNDLESLRRGVPILRSDSDRESTALRLSMTSSFNKWVPFCGAITKEKAKQLDARGISDKYVWRCSYLPILNVDTQFVQDPNQDFDILRFGINEWDTLKKYTLCDFYVHTPWHNKLDKKGFTAFSFYDPDTEKGILETFRMEECEDDKLTVKLTYAKEGGKYLLKDADTDTVAEASGADLAKGITLTLPEKRTAKLIYIERKTKWKA
ncbi:MAG: alpha-galactosidase [Clostridia bacterium]